MLNLQKIGDKITTLRKKNKMTQSDFADALYVTHQAVSKWENGKSIPSIEVLYQITQLFHVSIDYLLDDADIKEDDYESQFMQYPREAVLSKFIQSDDCPEKLDKIFYLLKDSERITIIDLILSQKIILDIRDIWHILSQEERQKILFSIISSKYPYDVDDLRDRLSSKEQLFIRNHN